MTKIVYIAGPMSGYPEHNYPAFYQAEELFTRLGFRVINPARLHPAFETTNDAEITDRERRNFMRTDLPAVTFCDGIALLPGWLDSRGAFIEAHLASYCGHDFYDAETGEPWGHIHLDGKNNTHFLRRERKGECRLLKS